jgi:PIN domain nuclease of toxin-antitoxin system
LKVLLDSEALVWAIYLPDRLPDQVKTILRDPTTVLVVSYASLWELLGKIGRGKLLLAGTSVERALQRIVDLGVELLPVTLEHIMASAILPQHHHDPFDRAIIAQAIDQSLPIITSDKMFPSYAVQVIWK